MCHFVPQPYISRNGDCIKLVRVKPLLLGCCKTMLKRNKCVCPVVAILLPYVPYLIAYSQHSYSVR